MPISTAPSPVTWTQHRPTAPKRRRRSPAGRFVVTLVRVLTVLVGIATAAVTLGPREWVVAGRSAAESWLLLHPSLGGAVAELGGVEAAGNLVLFAPFAALLALAVGLRLLPVAFLVLLCMPIAVEWAQQYLPGRVPDGNDIVRNTTGLLVAFVAVAVLRLGARLIRVAVRG